MCHTEYLEIPFEEHLVPQGAQGKGDEGDGKMRYVKQ